MPDTVHEDNSDSPLNWYDVTKVKPALTGENGPKKYPGYTYPEDDSEVSQPSQGADNTPPEAT